MLYRIRVRPTIGEERELWAKEVDDRNPNVFKAQLKDGSTIMIPYRNAFSVEWFEKPSA